MDDTIQAEVVLNEIKKRETSKTFSSGYKKPKSRKYRRSTLITDVPEKVNFFYSSTVTVSATMQKLK